MIDPENMASLRTADALGYQAFDRRPHKGKELVLLERKGGGR